jgi:hypothetical protein
MYFKPYKKVQQVRIHQPRLPLKNQLGKECHFLTKQRISQIKLKLKKMKIIAIFYFSVQQIQSITRTILIIQF